MNYPTELLPQPNYEFIKPEEVKEYYFVRETDHNLYDKIKELGDRPINVLDDLITEEIRGKSSSTEVFELSIFLYGIFAEKHLGICVTDKSLTEKDWSPEVPVPAAEDIACTKINRYALFFSCEKLYNEKRLNFKDNSGKTYNFTLSYEHKPNVINFWHFQLYSDLDNVRMKRNLEEIQHNQNTSKNLCKRFARHLLENNIVNAISKTDLNLPKFEYP